MRGLQGMCENTFAFVVQCSRLHCAKVPHIKYIILETVYFYNKVVTVLYVA